ncbi:hypothetical protein [aff. Roholtiella sp. LEGE 12411]|uniref:hypothetical protein n=1 Tax=aff. Roholtiella sp. LEGE 12411 TaxID=1828822 RepID=UPI001882017F|nr:hypothetical protein [aff. Roholtiella sp. LEGE 12411]MBE9036313.1 hypothetical protein [aff. Roholtiella sp. LEGE 12411]
MADFPIKTVPIVACFTEIALSLCVNHEVIKQSKATFTKKILKTVVIALNFFSTFSELQQHFDYLNKVSTLSSKQLKVLDNTLIT